MNKTTEVVLEGKEGAVIGFYPLLQKGFYLGCETGKSLQDFLNGECGIDTGYIENRIKTVFLDGHPVDDFREAIIRDGNVLSLSGPMPGLVGATMRAGGFYSSFRSGISYREEGKAGGSGRGMIFLKLFNIVMSDLGARFLEKGIFTAREEAEKFFSGQKDEFWEEIGSVSVDGEPLDTARFRQDLSDYHSPLILLRLKIV